MGLKVSCRECHFILYVGSPVLLKVELGKFCSPGWPSCGTYRKWCLMGSQCVIDG